MMKIPIYRLEEENNKLKEELQVRNNIIAKEIRKLN